MRVDPDQMPSLDDVRAAIDALDEQILPLLAQRSACVRRAAELKQDRAQAVVPWRIEQIIQRVRQRAGNLDFDPDLAEHLWRAMINVYIDYERRIMPS